MVCLVIDDDDVLETHQPAGNAADHGAIAFRLGRGPQRRLLDLVQRHLVLLLEGVIVGDDDLGLAQIEQHILWHDLAALVVALRIIGLQDAQAVLDRDAGGDYQEALGEALRAGMAHRVQRLPRDHHRHDRGLAGTGGQLQRHAHELWIGRGVRGFEVSPTGAPATMNAARPRSAR